MPVVAAAAGFLGSSAGAAALGAAGAIGGAIISGNAANSAARAQAQGVTNAANAQLTATREQIAATQHAADQAVGYVQPAYDQGQPAIQALQGAYGIGGANQAAYRNQYDTGFNQSTFNQDALAAAQRSVNALSSTAAARGMGPGNSGQWQRAAYDAYNTNAQTAHAAYNNALGGFADRADSAANAMGNWRIGAGNAAANAFAQQGQTLANLYNQQGINNANLAMQNGSNWAGAFGNVMGGFGNMFSNGGMNKSTNALAPSLTSIGQPGMKPMPPDPWSPRI